MKYIAFSFDDGRSDTYEVAKPILEKYGLIATVNVISSFIIHPDEYHFESSDRVMSSVQTLDWQKWGGEIASHGSAHKNSSEEVSKSIEELKDIGVDVSFIGFASPGSWLTENNISDVGIDKMLDAGEVSYLRSGIQVRREGLIYTVLSVLEQITHSKLLYWHLNKRNVINKKHRIYPSAAIKDYTLLSQIQFMINKLCDGEALILMLHSVLPKSDPLYGADHYYWDAEWFDELCKWIVDQNNISVLTTHDLVKLYE